MRFTDWYYFYDTPRERWQAVQHTTQKLVQKAGQLALEIRRLDAKVALASSKDGRDLPVDKAAAAAAAAAEKIVECMKTLAAVNRAIAAGKLTE